MKAKSLFTMMMFVFSLLFVSCEKNELESGSFDFKAHDFRVENVLYSKGSKLKREYQVWGDDRMLRNEYTYDNMGRISRTGVDYDDWKYYDLYLYNSKGQLESKSSYETYLENQPNLRQTVTYSYDTDGNIAKEMYEWKDINSEMKTRCFLYQYKNGKLAKLEHYEENKQSYYKIYEYDGDKLVKDRFFVPKEKDYVTTDYLYSQELLIYTITYSKTSQSGFMHDERRYYDQNDNLIRIVANHPSLSSMSGATAFLVTFEYEYE